MSIEPSSMSVTHARELVVRAHADQQDRDGSFHIAHVARVAEGVSMAPVHQRVAWLHDVLEDSDLTEADLHDRLATDELAALVRSTHDDPQESYEDHVGRILDAPEPAGNLARVVKRVTCWKT